MTKIVALEEVCEVIAGQSPPSNTYNTKGEGLPFFQGKADFGVYSPKVRIWCSVPQKIAEKGDILISVRAPVGPTNLCDQKSCIGRGLSAIRAGSKIDIAYLQYFLKKNERKLSESGRGSTFSSITQKDLKQIQIPLPSLEEQKRIVHELDAVDALRQKRKQAIALLDDYLKAVFLEMFGDPVENSKHWQIKKIKEMTTKIGSGATPRGGKTAYLAEGMSLIRSLNIHDNEFLYKNLAFINEKQAKALENVSVEQEDVLLNITGASVCRCAMVPEDVLPARVNQHVSIIRSKHILLNPFYLLHLIISYPYKLKLLKTAKAGGATREAITKQQIENLEIPIPAIELQNKFAEIVLKIKWLKQTMINQSDELESNFRALMQKIFN